jgi:hypothetical protein
VKPGLCSCNGSRFRPSELFLKVLAFADTTTLDTRHAIRGSIDENNYSGVSLGASGATLDPVAQWAGNAEAIKNTIIANCAMVTRSSPFT